MRKILLPPAALLGSWCSSVAQPAVAAGPSREFPIGALQRLDELPASPFRDRLGQLPPAAQGRALQWLKSFHLPAGDVASLHADPEGGICYGCQFSHPEPGDSPTEESTEAPAVGLAAVPVSPFPSQLVFHSRPGAPNVLYINFTGETVTGTQWNTVVNRSSIPALAFSTDSDFSTFSDSEQVVIKRVWQRMAEDYAPFNIDVTTERPVTFTTRTAMALITRKTDANGALNPYDTAGGVAYVNVFGSSTYATYRPAWIYHDNLSNNESYIAEAASHEIGHNLGLSHDGASSEYYGGHGSGDISWGPLMGTGYNRNVSQWSKGEYYLATNTQDDLATIAGKISYRTDDHGNTPASATALTISGGTNIVSTTIENDPANANPANKGVLERNTDVDIFSFVTGNGPVRLAVNPWIMPAGTRGGNLDLLIELYNESGTLLASNNPATQTTALIETTLSQGRYYLHVRNSGAGSPLVSPPSGYTVYGTIGQYHISGFITEASGFVIPPLAELQTADLTQSGQASYQFTVTYSDNVAIDVSTVGNGDVRVTGPNGYNQPAQFVSISTNTNGTPRTATYSVTPPGGGLWSPVHNGTYVISMEPGQVADTETAYVAAGQLGQFQVVVPLAFYSASMDSHPNWTFDGQWQYGAPNYSGSAGGPASGFTGTQIVGYNLSGNYANNLSTQYTTTGTINTSGSTSLTLRFRRWLKLRNGDTASVQASADGNSWINVWSTNKSVSDSSWQLMQYELPASVVGSSTLRLRWGLASGASLNDIGWNIDDVELLGDGALDAAPPLANLSVASLTQGGSPTHSCSVTYTDATAVHLASLDSTDLLVTGPNGYSSPAQFVGADLPVDGSPITASYAITPPGGVAWSEAHNGTYTITLLEGAVDDTLNNANPQTTLGTFSVAISTATPGTLTIDSSDDLVSSGPVGGPFTPSSVVYTLSNSGGSPLNWAGNKNASWVNLSATGGSLAPGASTQVTVSVNGTASSLGTGGYNDLVSFSNLTSGNGNTNREVALTVIQPGLLAVVSTDPLVASGTVGGPFTPSSAVYTLSNSGGTTLNWTAGKSAAWLDLSAASGSLAPGASIEVTVSLNEAANTLAAGTFNDSVSFTNTTDGNGNTSRELTLTVNSPGLLAVTSADPFSASGTVGGPFTPSSTVYTLSNSGGTTLNWTAGKTATWLDLSATGGSLAPGASTEVTVSLNEAANTLAAGTFNDSVSFTNTTDGNGNTSREITLTVNSPGLLAIASADPLIASGTVGGPFTPSSTVYTLSNSGGTTLNWTAGKTAAWLDLSATGGSLAPGASTQVTVSLNEAANALAAGTFNDSVNFTNTTDGNGTTSRNVALTVNSPGLLAVASADPFSASGTVGGPFTPSSAVYTLSNSGGTTLNWTASKTATWHDLSATSGSLAPGASTEVTVSLNEAANTLAAGTFNDSVSFTNTTDGNGNTSRNVALTVNSPGLLAVTSADPFSASGTVGGPFTPSSAVYTLSNSGGTTLNWTASKSATWLDLSATSGSLAPGASTEVTVSLNEAANTLAAGTFNDSVSFTNTTDGNGNTNRNVALTVNSPGLLAVTSADPFSASGTVGGPFTPSSAVYTLSNSGGTTLNWTASKTATWHDLSATSGSLAPGASTEVTVSLNEAANTLAAGTFNDSVSFTNTTDGNGNTSREITLTVNSPGLLAVTSADPFSASGTVGGPFTPSSAVYTLSNSGGTTLNWTAGKTATWLDLSATSGSLAPGASTEVTVSLNEAANTLAAGTFNDSVSFTNTTDGNGNTSRNVALTVNSPGLLAVASADPLIASGTVGGPFTPSSTVYTLSNSGGTTLNWTAGKTATWLDLSATGGSLTPGASIEVTVSLNEAVNTLAAGSFNDSVSFTNTTDGNGNTSRNVALTVNSPGLLAVASADPFNASGTVGGPFTPSSAIYTLSNSGGTALNWTASKTAAWLDLSATGGSLAPGASIEVTVSLNEAVNTLAAGTFNDSVSFTNTTDGNGNTSCEVTLTVNSPGLLAVASADPFSASGTVGGPFTPNSTVYTLSNSGGTTLNWIASKTAAWLDLSATGGSLAPGASTEVIVSLNEAANTLAAGTFNDSVNFTNTTDGNGNTSRNVALTVNSPGLLAVTSADPFSASGTVGGPFTPSSAVYTLSNNGGTTLNWTAGKTAAWLDLSATGGSLAPGASTEVTVSLNEAANTLAAGTFNDIVNFTNTTDGSGNTNREIRLTVNAPPELKVAIQSIAENGVFQIVIQGPAGTPVVLEATEDLVKWKVIATGSIGPDGTLTLSDPESAILPTRFYRVSRQ